MLTRDLLMYRNTRGLVRPRFVSLLDPELLAGATQLLGLVQDPVEPRRGPLCAAMQAAIGHIKPPKVGKGLAKIVLDRLTFAEPDAAATALRADIFTRATAILRELAVDATPADYEAALLRHLGADLTTLRQHLYDDLPDERPLLAYKPLTPAQVLERYNMALAQGLIMHSQRLLVRTASKDVLRVRRVLRWLKFCRLVADVRTQEDGSWEIDITGPAAILDLQKKYGMQLATFLPVVAVLDTFDIAAEVSLHRGSVARLALSQADPLVSPHANALGFVPPEVAAFAERFSDDAWRLELNTEPRHVGVAGICVPDLSLCHSNGASAHIELFHRWHHHALTRRLQDMQVRQDPTLFFGIERFLFDKAETQAQLAAHPTAASRVFSFNSFPSARAVLRLIAPLA